MSLEIIQQSLDSLQSGALDAAALLRRLRAAALPSEPPPKYGEVLNNLLDRLESSAAFRGRAAPSGRLPGIGDAPKRRQPHQFIARAL